MPANRTNNADWRVECKRDSNPSMDHLSSRKPPNDTAYGNTAALKAFPEAHSLPSN